MKILKVITLLFLFIFFVFAGCDVSAQGVGNSNPVMEDVDTAKQEINSFELFWPIVAGKTMGDPLYLLKSLKETVRGWLIFGKPQKAEYAVFLATKRAVEAEKLIGEDELDLANKTLDKAISQLEKAEKNVEAVGGSLGSATDEINNRLDNLEKFLPWLSLQNESTSEKLDSVLEKVKQLNDKV